jgi:hypothetical protein
VIRGDVSRAVSGIARYTSPDEDSARWHGFPFRDGDIVISTRSKSGTTWVQMICALLVFGGPDLPRSLAELSPWLDWEVEPRDEVVARLAAQRHRRIIKSHTPLDGLPLDERATFVVVARHPLDAAVSLYHQGDNLDRARLAQLTGSAPPAAEARPSVGAWLRQWIAWDGAPAERLDSLPGMIHHAADAWVRRDRSNVVLVHYDDLVADLPAEMGRLAGRLDIDVDAAQVGELARHATFTAMRDRATAVAPDRLGVLREPSRFFRRGTSGAGDELLTPVELAAYRRRVARLGPADAVAWLHRW